MQALSTEWLHPATLSLVRQRGNVDGSEMKKRRVRKMTRSKMERFRLFLRHFVSLTLCQWSDSTRPAMFALYRCGSSRFGSWIIPFRATKLCSYISLYYCLLRKTALFIFKLDGPLSNFTSVQLKNICHVGKIRTNTLTRDIVQEWGDKGMNLQGWLLNSSFDFS